MRIRGGAIFVTLALAAACSSEENLSPQPLPPEDPENARSPTPGGAASDGNSFGSCSGTCCNKPAEGTACNTVEDSSCSWAVTCPTGLVLSYEVTCKNNVWTVTNACPAEGETDSRGCPARQPENGTSCTLNTGTFQCGYVLECEGYRKSAQATCVTDGNNNRAWSTTALGVCD